MKTKKLWFVMGVLFLVGGSGALEAAAPPSLLNYQGVLRNTLGEPIDGLVPMTFRFYDTDGGPKCSGGTLLLTDAHALATPPVQVTNGLFNVQLGGDGVTPGTEGSLAEVFRDNGAVYVEVQAQSEILCPRVQMISAAYSLNADHLDGKDSTEFLDTSATLQTKAGDLEVQGDVTVGGDVLFSDGSVQVTAFPTDPPCFDNANRFVDCGNGTVTDTVTGLIWLQDATCATLPGLGSEFGLWAAANEAAASLQDGDCGLTDRSSPGDWRLPTKAEWQTIIDQANTNGCAAPFFPDTLGTGCCGVGPCAFAGVGVASYWSSRTVASNPNNAWHAFTSLGFVSDSFKASFKFVWPVRAGP